MSESAVLNAKHLTKTFHVGFWRERVEAVRDVSFSVRENEIFGIVGPNGAGKTTTMNMMTNLIFPDAGSVELFGTPIGRAEIRRRLGFLPEVPYFYEHLTVTELVRYYGALHGMARSEVNARLDDLLELVGLQDARDRPLQGYSKGMRQRAGIAQALINDPDLVILDEPQSGLDPVGRREVRDLILDLRERGKTIIFSSHILVDVEAVCDRVAVMHDGQVVDITHLRDSNDQAERSIELTARGLSLETMESLSGVCDWERREETWHITVEDPSEFGGILETLIDNSADIREVRRHEERLEDRFLADVNETG